MGKLGNYILNAFIFFILLLVAAFLFTAEHYLIALMILLALFVYLLFSDIFFASIGNIKNFAFTEKDTGKKILLKALYLALYIAIIFLALHVSHYILLLINLVVALDIIFLLIKKKRFLFYLFNVDL
ncbi:MAG: hypothetical protein K6E22_05355 [Treponema sp.]|nr:hypothetical protein [Treponema sp.]